MKLSRNYYDYVTEPNLSGKFTFYIDDITLDYSSAVDDRVLPTITDVSYTTADESVALNEGAKIIDIGMNTPTDLFVSTNSILRSTNETTQAAKAANHFQKLGRSFLSIYGFAR